jgi:TRAP-type C4-dicarboxylate transport system permease small subunit
MKPILNALSVIEDALGWLSAAAMFAIMLIVFCDVIMRYFLHSPLSWAYDLISLYLVAAVFFLSLSAAYTEGAHVNVDILQQTFPPRAIRLTELVTTAIGATVFALVTYFGALRTIDAYASRDVLSGAIPWPTWPSLALVPLGCGLMTLRLAVQFVAQLLSLATGQDVVPVRIGHGEGEHFE